jgi:hypothetical protein
MTVRKWFITLVCFILSGCKVDSSYELYVGDLELVSETGEAELVNSTIRMEMPSQQTCNDKKSELMEIIRRYYEVTSEGVCVRDGFDDFLEFRSRTPVIVAGSQIPGNTPAAISVASTETSVRVSAQIDNARFTQLERDMKTVHSSASIRLNIFDIELSNETRSAYEVRATASFVDGVPYQDPIVTLERRDRVVFRMSDVFSAVLLRDGKAFVFDLKPERK